MTQAMRRSRTTPTTGVERLEATQSLGKRRAAADREPSAGIQVRTCAKCGRRASFRLEEGGWSRCSRCGRYA